MGVLQLVWCLWCNAVCDSKATLRMAVLHVYCCLLVVQLHDLYECAVVGFKMGRQKVSLSLAAKLLRFPEKLKAIENHCKIYNNIHIHI